MKFGECIDKLLKNEPCPLEIESCGLESAEKVRNGLSHSECNWNWARVIDEFLSITWFYVSVKYIENSLFGDISVLDVTTHSYVLQESTKKKTCEFILYAELAIVYVTYFQQTDLV